MFSLIFGRRKKDKKINDDEFVFINEDDDDEMHGDFYDVNGNDVETGMCATSSDGEHADDMIRGTENAISELSTSSSSCSARLRKVPSLPEMETPDKIPMNFSFSPRVSRYQSFRKCGAKDGEEFVIAIFLLLFIGFFFVTG